MDVAMAFTMYCEEEMEAKFVMNTYVGDVTRDATVAEPAAARMVARARKKIKKSGPS